MAMPLHSPEVMTIEELLALPDDGLRHELLDGVHVVTPAPAAPHQIVLRALIRALERAIGDRRDAAWLTSPADIRFGSRTLVQPDLFEVACPAGTPPIRWEETGTPLVAVEILSPSTASRDRGAKRRIYQSGGVAEYWIVDIDARLVERWVPGDDRPEICDATLRWRLPDGAARLLDVASLFGELPPLPPDELDRR